MLFSSVLLLPELLLPELLLELPLPLLLLLSLLLSTLLPSLPSLVMPARLSGAGCLPLTRGLTAADPRLPASAPGLPCSSGLASAC